MHSVMLLCCTVNSYVHNIMSEYFRVVLCHTQLYTHSLQLKFWLVPATVYLCLLHVCTPCEALVNWVLDLSQFPLWRQTDSVRAYNVTCPHVCLFALFLQWYMYVHVLYTKKC